MSRLFMKINSVYKQASIERNSIRKKSAQKFVGHFSNENLMPIQLEQVDNLII